MDEKTSPSRVDSATGPYATGQAHHLDDADASPSMSPSPEARAPLPYGSLSFIVTFISVSLGFYAAIIGVSTTWNQVRAGVPAALGSTKAMTWAYPTLMGSHVAGTFLFPRLTDFTGRRIPFLACNLLSFIGFIAAGRVSSPAAFSGLNVFIGLGTSLQIEGPFLALGELVPVNHRFSVSALSMALFAPLFAMYPAISQALLLHTADSWRWVYSINAILSFVAFAGLLVAYHPSPIDPQSVSRQRSDYLGLIGVSLAAFLALYPAYWGGSVYSWGAPQIIVLITVFGILFVAFFFYSFHFGNDYTALPSYVIREWENWAWFAVSGMNSFLLWFVPLASNAGYSSVYMESGVRIGWDEASWSAGVAGGWLLAFVALRKPRHLKWQMAAAMLIQMGFLFPLNAANPARHRLLVTLFAISGIGQGYGMVISHNACALNLHDRDFGLGTGGANAFRSFIYSVFFAVFFTIYSARLTNELVRDVSTSAVTAGLPQTSLPALFQAINAVQAGASASAFLKVAGMTPAILQATVGAIIEAGANGWHFIFLIALVILIPFFIFSLFLPQVDAKLSHRVLARLGRRGSSPAAAAASA